MGWLALVLIAAAAMAALALLRVDRLLWSMIGAALMLGAAGYAWQGSPTLSASPARPDGMRMADDPSLIDLRDRMLGRFTAEHREYTVAVEGKGPRDPLDRPFAGRRISAVDQAYRYAINLPCDWALVTNLREVRLYHKGSTQRTYERWDVAQMAADRRALAAAVVDQRLVAFGHRAQRRCRGGVAHPVPFGTAIADQVGHRDQVCAAVVDHIRRVASHKARLKLFGDFLDALHFDGCARVQHLLQLPGVFDVVVAKTTGEEHTVYLGGLQVEGVERIGGNFKGQLGRIGGRRGCIGGGNGGRGGLAGGTGGPRPGRCTARGRTGRPASCGRPPPAPGLPAWPGPVAGRWGRVIETLRAHLLGCSRRRRRCRDACERC